MAIGFAGASRTGKTTLARTIADERDIPFVDLSFTRIAKLLGVDPVAPMSTRERLAMQVAALAVYERLVRAEREWFITDRTPLDMLAYMLAEVGMHSDPEIGEMTAVYVTQCLALTVERFNTIIVTRPLPFYEAAPGKPPLNLGYQVHIQYLIEGALEMVQRQGMATMQLRVDDLAHRIRCCHEFLNMRLNAIVEQRGDCAIQ